MDVAELRSGADFALRVAFFATAPFLVVIAAELFPVTGAVIQIGLALLVFLLGGAVRRAIGERRWMRALLSSQLEFEAYYRAHPPRAFLYYVFYPLLFPYWLSNAEARREFLLYKGYTWPAFLLLLVSLAVQYLRVCPPDLTLHQFLPIAAGSLIAEAVVVLMFLMPIVTSLVQLHRERAPRRITVLLLVGVVSIAMAVARIERRRDPIVSFATRTRVQLRTEARPEAALHVQTEALRQGWATLAASPAALPRDGRLEGPALGSARTALGTFYKNDEAHAFELWYTAAPVAALTVFFPARRKHQPIWLSLDGSLRTNHEASALSARAQRALGATTR